MSGLGTRLSFRPRPLDIHKRLPIVRDESQLDGADGGGSLVSRDVTHNHAALDRENEEVSWQGRRERERERRRPGRERQKKSTPPLTPPSFFFPFPFSSQAKMISSAQAPGLKEIPIPPVLDVPTYAADYLPTYREAAAYVRGRGGTSHHDPRAVEYDLDDEDRAWLGTAFNAGGQPRLPADRLEAMVWRLEVANAAATDAALAAAGALAAERSSAAAAATTDHLPRPDALAVLARVAPLRPAALAAVYEYWVAKRARAGRPLLRRLRAPTAAADTNPYHVFRPREKAHRPQTRRRRENAADAVEKIRALGSNLGAACALLEGVLRREARKAAVAYLDADAAALALSLAHDPPSVSGAVAAEAAASIRVRVSRRPAWLAGERGPGEGPGG